MLRKIGILILITVFLAGLISLSWYIGFQRGMAEAYVSSMGSLYVLRQFTPGIAKKAVDKNTFEQRIIEAMRIQIFYMIDDYVDIPSVFRLSQGNRKCGGITVDELLDDYQQWHNEAKRKSQGHKISVTSEEEKNQYSDPRHSVTGK